MNPKPLIGISSGRKSDPKAGELLYALPGYIHAVEMVGGLPVLIPVTLSPANLQALYRRLDGIVLTGGGDLLPSNYGVSLAPHIYGTDAIRDITEIALARWAVADDKPLLGICRGHQVLNVALGGTLHPHIPDAFDTDIAHDNALATHRTYLAHDVEIDRDSLLALALDTLTTTTNSMHHQAADKLGEGLRAVAQAPDGVIEGLEYTGNRFTVGVQWHPEEIVDSHPAMRRLFWAFIQAAVGDGAWRDQASSFAVAD